MPKPTSFSNKMSIALINLGLRPIKDLSFYWAEGPIKTKFTFASIIFYSCGLIKSNVHRNNPHDFKSFWLAAKAFATMCSLLTNKANALFVRSSFVAKPC